MVVGRFTTYHEVKRAVDRLRVARIPEGRITVLGQGLRWSPPLTAERSARLGGMLGMLVAAATTATLWSFGVLASEFTLITSLLAGAFVGGAVGLVVGVAAWRLTRDTTALPETGNVDVGSYDLLVADDDVPRARELLSA